MKIERVIDLIAGLEGHDPVAPVLVWYENEDGHLCRGEIVSVFQVTPSYLKEHSIGDDRGDKGGPLPVVLNVLSLSKGVGPWTSGRE